MAHAEVADLLRTEPAGVACHLPGQVVDDLAVAGHVAELARLPLVAHHGHGQGPALARLADHVGGRDPGAVEEHLAELLGDPVDHPQRSLLDAGLVHGHGEGGDAAVLGHLVVRPGQHQAPVGLVRVAGPHLVPGDDVVVTVPVGPGAQRGQVGAGVGLAEPLAPPVAAVDDAGEEPLLDLVAAVLEDALDQVAEARPGRGAGRGQLLVDDHLVDGRAAPGRRWPWATTCRRSRRRRATGARPPSPAQYSSSVDDVGRPGLLSASHSRSRSRNSASGRRVTEVHRGPRCPGARAPAPG